MVELSSDTFSEFVNNEECIVQFSAQWCFPCKAMSKTILSCDLKNLKVGKIDIDKNMEIMRKYKIKSVPTTIFFKKGCEISRILGSKSKENLELFIESSK